MSGTTVQPAPEAAAGGLPPESARRPGWRDAVTTVIIASTLLALGLRAYQLAQPG